jgi:hypothetical protein
MSSPKVWTSTFCHSASCLRFGHGLDVVDVHAHDFVADIREITGESTEKSLCAEEKICSKCPQGQKQQIPC